MRYALSRFRQAKTAEEEVIWLKTRYPSPLSTEIRRVAKAVSGESTHC